MQQTIQYGGGSSTVAEQLGDGCCVREMVVMLVFKSRFIRQRKISLGNNILRNGLTAVGVEDDPTPIHTGTGLSPDLPDSHFDRFTAAVAI